MKIIILLFWSAAVSVMAQEVDHPNCQPPKNTLEQLTENSTTAAVGSGRDCIYQLNENDLKMIKEIADKLNSTPQQEEKEKILKDYLPKLRSILRIAVIADYQKRALASLKWTLKNQPQFQQTLDEIDQFYHDLNKRSQAWFYSPSDAQMDGEKAEQLQKKLKNVLFEAHFAVDEEMKKKIFVDVSKVLSSSFNQAARNIGGTEQKWAAIQVGAGGVLAVDLIVFSLLLPGTTPLVTAGVTSTSGTIAIGIGTGAVSGAAGAAGFTAGVGTAKMLSDAYAAANDTTQNSEYICQLARQVDLNGGKVLESTLMAAIIGGGIGTGVGGLVGGVAAKYGVEAAKLSAAGTGMILFGGLTLDQLFTVSKEGKAAQKKFLEAKEAFDRGDEEEGKRLLKESETLSRHAKIDGAAALMGAILSARSVKQSYNEIWGKLHINAKNQNVTGAPQIPSEEIKPNPGQMEALQQAIELKKSEIYLKKNLLEKTKIKLDDALNQQKTILKNLRKKRTLELEKELIEINERIAELKEKQKMTDLELSNDNIYLERIENHLERIEPQLKSPK